MERLDIETVRGVHELKNKALYQSTLYIIILNYTMGTL